MVALFLPEHSGSVSAQLHVVCLCIMVFRQYIKKLSFLWLITLWVLPSENCQRDVQMAPCFEKASATQGYQHIQSSSWMRHMSAA